MGLYIRGLRAFAVPGPNHRIRAFACSRTCSGCVAAGVRPGLPAVAVSGTVRSPRPFIQASWKSGRGPRYRRHSLGLEGGRRGQQISGAPLRTPARKGKEPMIAQLSFFRRWPAGLASETNARRRRPSVPFEGGDELDRHRLGQPDAVFGPIERESPFMHGAGVDREHNGFSVTPTDTDGCRDIPG